MKRALRLPLNAEQAYAAFLDPLLLAAWLDVPYASTGPSPLQLFEIEDWRATPTWKFRGFILESEPIRRVLIEEDVKRIRPKPQMEILFDPVGEDATSMEIKWESPRLDLLAEKILDPKGALRLELILRSGDDNTVRSDVTAE